MALGNCKIFLVSLALMLMSAACERATTDVPVEITDANAPTNAVKKTAAKARPAQGAGDQAPGTEVIIPAAGAPIATEDPLSTPPAFWPALSSGGSGGGKRVNHGGIALPLNCENHTSNCNDHNPCTVDSCNSDDQCEHNLDVSKSEFGSCEADGNSCTVGKCVLVGLSSVCYEEAREFLDGEIGCSDGNSCTADSCVSTRFGDNNGPQYDVQGNAILDNDFQCVREVMNGVACFIEGACSVGKCTSSGNGDPDDAYNVSCLPADGDNQPQPLCPSTAGNPCKISFCTVGVGCQTENVANDTPCDDGSTCTQNDVCSDGICQGAAINCNDNVACTRDLCDGTGGCINIPDNGLCPASATQCSDSYCDAVDGCLLTDAAEGTLCTDNDPCTIEDTCNDEGTCIAGASLSCADSNINDCQETTCVAGVGCGFVDAQEGSGCFDSDPCTLGDTCNGEGACVSGTVFLICEDNDVNDCQAPSCITGQGCGFVNAETGSACVDDDPCTVNDTCDVEGSCASGTTLLVCGDDDINDCQVPICLTGVGCSLINAVEGSACLADASVCTMDMCNSEGGCIAGTPIVCESDGNPCTAEVCDDKFGCIYPAGNDQTACNDGNACTSNTVCSSGVCAGGSDIDCDDDNACTVDHCAVVGGCFYDKLNGPLGGACVISGQSGACAQGVSYCDDGVEDSDICFQLFYPNPDGEICLNNFDDNCDGESDEFGCLCPEIDADAVTRYIATTGSDGDGNTCTDPLFPCQTLQYAENVANNGDAISIDAGIYNQTGILIRKDLYIRGQGIGVSVFNGVGGNAIYIDSINTVDICGVTIQNANIGLQNFGTVNVANSSFESNDATDGGGIQNFFNATLYLSASTLVENTAVGGGGALFNGGMATLNHVVMSGNSAASGGGIFNSSTLFMSNTTLSSNVATDVSGGGGALYAQSGNVAISNTTMNGNTSASQGGAIRNNANLTMALSTISGNSAATAGGGIYSLNAINVSNTTLTGNSALTSGANVFYVGTASVYHTIIANAVITTDCNAPLTNLGFSLSEDGTCGLSVSGDPNLSALANNGGTTQTHAIISPSVAIDGGDINCNVTKDQRAQPRPIDFGLNDVARCDIGSYELQN